MSKHTPGPWWARHDGSIEAVSGTVAQIHMLDGQVANANLISAAPDLLAALEAVDKNLTLDHNGNYVLGDDFDESVIHTALAKAKS